jgi:hypothetical protein
MLRQLGNLHLNKVVFLENTCIAMVGKLYCGDTKQSGNFFRNRWVCWLELIWSLLSELRLIIFKYSNLWMFLTCGATLDMIFYLSKWALLRAQGRRQGRRGMRTTALLGKIFEIDRVNPGFRGKRPPLSNSWLMWQNWHILSWQVVGYAILSTWQDDRALDNFSTRGVWHFHCARARCIWLPFVDFGDRRKHFLTNFKGNKIHFKVLESYFFTAYMEVGVNEDVDAKSQVVIVVVYRTHSKYT